MKIKISNDFVIAYFFVLINRNLTFIGLENFLIIKYVNDERGNER